MRFLFAAERVRIHERVFDEELEEVPPLLSSRDVLEFATIDGARVCGLADKTGSLTPGKRADIVMLDIERVNRSEEHTSELQSRQYLVCRLLLEQRTTTSTTEA